MPKCFPCSIEPSIDIPFELMKIFFLFLGLCGIICTSVWAYRTTVQTKGENALYTHTFNIKRRQAEEVLAKKREMVARVESLQVEFPGNPRAVVDSTEFDFGLMDPFVESEHKFEIKNDGEGVLHLTAGGKTCNCVGFAIEPQIVLPGESALVTIRWNSKFVTEEYRHGAAVRTNDPLQPEIKLRVHGQVRQTLGTSQPGIGFVRLFPGQPESRRLVVYSQVWDELEIVSSRLTMKSASCKFEPATREDLVKLDAKCGVAFTVTTSADLPVGQFSGEWLQAIVKSPTDAEQHAVEIPVSGQVVSLLSVYEGGEPTRSVDFGNVFEGAASEKQFMLRVNDEDRSLKVKSIVAYPESVSVEIEPIGDAQQSGLYRMRVRLSKECNGVFQPPTPGSIHVVLDHPRIPSLDLAVTFTAISNTAGRGKH
jgi:hypothetical protein